MPSDIGVLHVDDEPSVTDLTATFLEERYDQFTVETAASAEEGLEMMDHPNLSTDNCPRFFPAETYQRYILVTAPDIPGVPVRRAWDDGEADQAGGVASELTGVGTSSGEWSGSRGGKTHGGVRELEEKSDAIRLET